ncbi:MAG: septal ring lytic transglycosylase RlpA family protein [Desulfovibrio sp.]|nr:septal ring lytic transglycosylase RlpA family protein [Desulfovibrio sp.]
MRYTRGFFFLAIMACCMLLTSPTISDAASSARYKHHISSDRHHSHRVSARKHHVRHSRHSYTKSGRKHAHVHNRHISRRHRTESAAQNRNLWLQRARDSEVMRGIASWYGADAHNGETASGVNYDMYTFTAAHRTLPLGTVVRVTEQRNGKSVMVCVTDRGPYVPGRIIDLSYAAAKHIDLKERGIGPVALEVVSDAKGRPIKADTAFYVRYKAAAGDERVGPFRAYADAAAMHEALRRVHPDAEVVLDQDD